MLVNCQVSPKPLRYVSIRWVCNGTYTTQYGRKRNRYKKHLYKRIMKFNNKKNHTLIDVPFCTFFG